MDYIARTIWRSKLVGFVILRETVSKFKLVPFFPEVVFLFLRKILRSPFPELLIAYPDVIRWSAANHDEVSEGLSCDDTE